MSFVTKCPQCHEPVPSDKQTEIGGKHYTLFRCPRCVEQLGVGRQSAKRHLEFVVDSQGQVRKMIEVMRELNS